MVSHDIMDDNLVEGGIQPSHKSGHDILHTMWQPCRVRFGLIETHCPKLSSYVMCIVDTCRWWYIISILWWEHDLLLYWHCLFAPDTSTE